MNHLTLNGILLILVITFGMGLVSAYSENIDLMNQCEVKDD